MIEVERAVVRLDFGRTVARMVALLREQPSTVLIFSLLFGYLPSAAYGLLRVLEIVQSPAEETWLTALRGAPGESLVTWACGVLLQGGLLSVWLDPQPTEGRGLMLALQGARRHFWPLLGISVLTTLGIVAGLVALVIPGLLLAVRWILAPAVRVASPRGVMDSMGRSAVLARDNYWVMIGLLLVLSLLILAPTMLYAVIPQDWSLLTAVDNLLLTPILGVFTMIAPMLFTAAVYLELQGGPGSARQTAEIFT